MAVNRAILNAVRKGTARTVSIPSPYLGLNTLVQPGAMDVREAVSMVNMFPDAGGVRVRKGYTTHQTTGESSAIRALHSFNTGSINQLVAATTEKLFESSNANPYIQVAVELEGDAAAQVAATLDFAFAVCVSMWVKFDSSTNATATTLMEITNDARTVYFRLRKLANNTIQATITPSSGASVTLTSSNTFTSADGWIHIAVSINSIDDFAYLYVNDVQEDSDTMAFFSLTVNNLAIGGTIADGELFTGNIADVWGVTGSAPDISTTSVRRAFIDASGNPVDLGSDGNLRFGTLGVQPEIWHRIRTEAAAGFLDNDASNNSYAAISGTLPDSATSSASPIAAKGGFSNGRWQGVNFNGNLFLANGADTPQVYDGSDFTNWTGTGSGLTAANVIGCFVYRNRLYVWEDDSQDFWYGATNTIGGTFTKFQLSQVGTTGGELLCAGTLTVDGGEGVDDIAVFVMSTGEVLMYNGPDPSQWSIIGTFRIGKPLGVRAIRKVGPDLVVATQEDYVSLTEVLRDRGKVRSKISGAARDAAASYSANDGWQVEYSPKHSMLVVNIPTSSTTFEQHVQNVLTGAWTTYEDIDSYCWAVHDGDLYFGGVSGVIYKAETGNTDNGSAITSSCQQAWTDFGAPQNKRLIGYRLLTDSDANFTYTPQFGFDFVDPTGSATITDSTGRQEWNLGFGVGRHISMKLSSVSTSNETKWYSSDFKLEGAGIV